MLPQTMPRPCGSQEVMLPQVEHGGLEPSCVTSTSRKMPACGVADCVVGPAGGVEFRFAGVSRVLDRLGRTASSGISSTPAGEVLFPGRLLLPGRGLLTAVS